MGGKCEFSLVTLTAVVHHYLDNRWIVVGPSRVGIYHDTEANSFRIVARKFEEHEVVANCAINETFCYDTTTPSFHQWRDAGKVYGIKFASVEDGGLFSDTIRRIVHTVEQVHRLMETHTAMEQQPLQSTSGSRPNGHPASNQPSPSTNGASSTTTYLEPMPNLPIGRSLKPVPPPPPPPQNGWKASNQNGGANNVVSIGTTTNSNKPAIQPKPGASFLNEMEITLARRRAKIEAQDGTSEESKEILTRKNSSSQDLSSAYLAKPSNGIANLNSPNTEPSISLPAIEKLKQEILCEIREEFSLFKQDLIQTIKEQLNNARQQ